MRELMLLLRLLRPHFRWMALGTLVGLATSLSVVGLMAISTELIAVTALFGVVAAGAWPPALHQLNAGIRFFALVRTIGRYGERLFSHDATFKILAGLRVWFFEQLAPLYPPKHRRFRSGDMLERIVGDIDALAGFYVKVLSPWVVAVLVSLSSIIFLSFFEPRIALTTAVLLLCVTVILPVVASQVGVRDGASLTNGARRLRVRWIDTLRGLSELLMFGAAGGQLKELKSDCAALRAEQRRRHRAFSMSQSAGRWLAGVGLWIALFLGVDAIRDGALQPEHFALVALVVLVVFEVVSPLSSSFLELTESRAAAAHLSEILDAKPEAPPASHPAHLSSEAELTLELDQVSFRYSDDGPRVLEDVSVQLPQGAHVAVLGPTGCGKSTLGALIARFWDTTSGHISLGGIDVRNLAEKDLRTLVTAVPQRPHLFNGTLRENILLGRAEATDEEVERVIAVAQLQDVIEGLDQGLDTWLGEGGVRLSGGQARRVAIARALLRESAVLVLDEPTEDLDLQTARALSEALEEATRGRTLLFITHILQRPERFDRILLLERGTVLEAGTHDELLRLDGRYAERLKSSLDQK